MAQPQVILECAFVANPFGTLVWTDISQWMQIDWQVKRGRNDELGQTAAGVLNFALDNSSGMFDGTYQPANLLSDAASSWEDGSIGGWHPNANNPIANSATVGLIGTHSLADTVVSVVSSRQDGPYTNGVALMPSGTVFTFTLWVFSTSSFRAGAAVAVDSTSTRTFGPVTTVPANKWTPLAVTATMDATSTVTVFLSISQTAVAGQVINYDAASVVVGSQSPSPFSPYLLPGRPIRVRAVYSAVTYNVFRGFVTRWPQTWEMDGVSGLVSVTAVDGFKSALGQTLRARYNDVVNGQSPGLYDRVISGTRTGWTATAVPGAITGDTNQALQLSLTATATAAIVNEYNTTGGGLPDLIVGTSWSMEIWFALSAGTTFTAAGIAKPFRMNLIRPHEFGGGNTTPEEATLALRAVDTNTLAVELVTGQVTANTVTLAAAAPHLDTGVRIPNDGALRSLMLQFDATAGVYRLYVDGILQYTSPPIPGADFPQGFSEIFLADVTGDTTSYTPNLTITLDEFSVVAGLVSPSQRYGTATHYNTFAAELSGARVSHILDAIGWPTADRVIDTGTVTLQASGSVSGSAVLSLLQAAVDAEQGNIFIDGQGRFVFQDRHHNYTSGFTSAATFGEAGFPTQNDLEVGFDDDFLFNDVEVTQANSSPAYVAYGEDVGSQAQYPGARSKTLTLALSKTSDVDGIARTVKGQYSQPHPRIPTVSLEGRAHLANFPQMLGREIGDVVTATKDPPTTAPAISLKCLIQGVNHRVTRDQWLTSFLISPAPLYFLWIVNDPTFGVVGKTTIPAF